MIDVDLLNADVGEGNAETQGAGPIASGKGGQRRTVRNNHEALQAKDACKHLGSYKVGACLRID